MKKALTLDQLIFGLGQQAKKAATQLALIDAEAKNEALRAIASSLTESKTTILESNKHDIALATQDGFPDAFIDRLTMTSTHVDAMIASLNTIIELPDPVGEIISNWQRPNGLEISQIRVPLGVIGVIYESRPNVTVDATALCLKSGNAVILRPGKESFESAKVILEAIERGLNKSGLPIYAVQLVPTTEREAIDKLAQLDQFIDVIIPRGGPSLIKHLMQVSKVPLFKHLAGLCHTYVHQSADKQMANDVLLNAKMRRTGICGATEVLLIDKKIISSHLPLIIENLLQSGCEVRADADIVKLEPRLKQATDNDFETEFLDAIIAIKAVDDIHEAIRHIEEHGTAHTDAIIAEDTQAAELFLKSVNSAIVMHNASTQFADGGEFGMGAEIGIATGKLHARGPVGVRQLTTFKYQVRGKGQVRP